MNWKQAAGGGGSLAARGGVQRGEGAGRIRRLGCLLQGLLNGGSGRASSPIFRRAGFGRDQRRRRSSLKENGLMPYGEMPTYIALNPTHFGGEMPTYIALNPTHFGYAAPPLV
ncbi:MAG: hypothetical protein ACRDAK_13025, partial [Aeromonas veronii]